MTTVSVVATVEASTTPPRVKLDVTDTGSPNLFAATVTRLNPDGSTSTVRTPDGGPLTLVTSGANRVGTVYDYEAPYGAAVTYSTVETPANVSGSVIVPADSVWLIHPSVPDISMPVELRAGSLMQEEWGVEQGVFWPMGRRTPIVQTDGIRKAASSSVTVAIDTLLDLQRLRALTQDAAILLLNIPDTLNYGFDTCYIAVGTIRNARTSDIGSDPYRAVEMPFQVVDRPAGGTQADRTYVDLLSYPTYSALQAAYPTYAALLAGP